MQHLLDELPLLILATSLATMPRITMSNMPFVSNVTVEVSDPSAASTLVALTWPRLRFGSTAGIDGSVSPLRVETSVLCSASLPGSSSLLFFAVGSRYVQPPPDFGIATIAWLKPSYAIFGSTGSPMLVSTGYASKPSSRSIVVSRIETSRHTPQRDVIVSAAWRGV